MITIYEDKLLKITFDENDISDKPFKFSMCDENENMYVNFDSNKDRILELYNALKHHWNKSLF